MLATFVIGLREGLEAALIVGIVAAFLRQRGRPGALRQVWLGIVVAIGLCVLAAVGLWVLSSELDQAAQEGMEAVIGLFAVAMVTSMIWWMRGHARNLRHELQDATAAALAKGSALALVAMAFLAVLREGIETVVFLLALLRTSGTPTYAGLGAALGILVAAALGYALYRGGVRINLARFFRVTGLVLVVVAGGLVMSSLHAAHEAGWLNSGQATVLDLRWLVAPGSLQSSLLTGVLGIHPQPVVAEVVGWLVYVVPLAAMVLWPARHARTPAQERVTSTASV